ncbi:hypothetical protein CYMTET_32777 [Cymbomonas tetramitiformis]|uniref:Sterol 3-beta-glucosyltransferase n=1 Tax=Cymbomonas tetramitiformis TaxID=36881 RepID=A0AAE0KRL3_9CHLO|nr:hypothetical protein CYMTET_32777 [Cymbomonas tetramitiformis]
MLEKRTVIFIALGTRGDVQPLALLALAMAKSCDECRVSFISHEAHQKDLSAAFEAANVQYRGVDILPASVWDMELSNRPHETSIDPQAKRRRMGGEDGGSAAPPAPAGSSNPTHDEGIRASRVKDTSWQGARAAERSEITAALLAAGKDAEAEKHTWYQREELLEACRDLLQALPHGSDALIVFNLFALEGWHLAEFFGVRCLAASPCLVPYSAPSGFQGRFKKSLPALHARLQAAAEGEVTWREVDHWMWPLFTERWGAWRQYRLRLPPVPLTTPIEQGSFLPPPTTLLYGLSEILVDPPGYWPGSVATCGFWCEDDLPGACGVLGTATATPPPSSAFHPPEDLQTFLVEQSRDSSDDVATCTPSSEGCHVRPMAFCFGSVLSMAEEGLGMQQVGRGLVTFAGDWEGLGHAAGWEGDWAMQQRGGAPISPFMGDAKHFLQTLRAVAAGSGRRAVLVLPESGPLAAEWERQWREAPGVASSAENVGPSGGSRQVVEDFIESATEGSAGASEGYSGYCAQCLTTGFSLGAPWWFTMAALALSLLRYVPGPPRCARPAPGPSDWLRRSEGSSERGGGEE